MIKALVKYFTLPFDALEGYPNNINGGILFSNEVSYNQR